MKIPNSIKDMTLQEIIEKGMRVVSIGESVKTISTVDNYLITIHIRKDRNIRQPISEKRMYQIVKESRESKEGLHKAIEILLDAGYTQTFIASKLSVSQTYVSLTKRRLKSSK